MALGRLEVEQDSLDRLMDRLDFLCVEIGEQNRRYLGAWRYARPKSRTGEADLREMAEVWRGLHMALLRLPDDERRAWRLKAAEGAKEYLGIMPDPEDRAVIVPALSSLRSRSEAGTADLIAREVSVPLDLTDPDDLKSAARAYDPPAYWARIPDVEACRPDDLRLLWLARTGQALLLADLDPELHALIGRSLSGRSAHVSLATKKNRSEYWHALTNAIRVACRDQDYRHLRDAHNLDDFLGKLVHRPTAALGSWWWQWRREVSLMLVPLARRLGYEVVFDETVEWRETDLGACTEAQFNVSGAAGSDEPLVQWVIRTPLRQLDAARSETPLYPGSVVRRPQPKQSKWGWARARGTGNSTPPA